MTNKTVLLCILMSVFRSAFGQVELMVNGGFESAGAVPWKFAGTSNATIVKNSAAAHSGTNYLSMGKANGAAQGVYQMISIPTNAVFATLGYFWNISSTAPGGTDRLRTLIVRTNQDILATVDTEFNSAADAVYHKRTFDLTPYIGQTIGIYFEALTDSTFGSLTGFRIDDVSASYVTVSNLPPNDSFTNRIALAASSFAITGNSTYASKESGEPKHAGNPGGKSLWWNWTTPFSGTVTITTSGSSFDTLLGVYTGTIVSNLTRIASNDDASTDSRSPIMTSRVRFTAVAGVNYQIAVDGKDGASGDISLGLSFQPDLAGPAVTISSPAANAKVTNATVVVQGKATDNIGVALVQFRLENAFGTNAYQTATGTNSWTANVTDLVPGINTVRVRAVDGSSNVSASVTRSFRYVVVNPLTLTVSGSGIVTPGLNGRLLEIGTSYKLTAKPNAGQIFAGWTGDITSSAAMITFPMRSNMVLQANFIPNPFLPVAGVFQGLFYQSTGVEVQSSGFLSATLASSGKFSAKLLQGGKTYSFSGQFSATGGWSNAIPRKGLAPFLVQMQLDFADGTLRGRVSDGSWQAGLSAVRAGYSKTAPAPQAGKYTVLIPAGDDSSAQPGGNGFGAVTVTGSGGISFSGTLGDGSKVMQTAVLSHDGEWPFYASLYSGQGVVLGWLTFANEATSDLHGVVSWIRPAIAGSKYYPAGFTNDTDLAGSAYKFTNGLPVLNFTNGQAWFGIGNLSQNFTNQIALNAANKITNLSSNKLGLTITTSSGLFKGTVVNPVSGAVIPINGAILQKLNAGYGFFLGTNQSGSVFVGP